MAWRTASALESLAAKLDRTSAMVSYTRKSRAAVNNASSSENERTNVFPGSLGPPVECTLRSIYYRKKHILFIDLNLKVERETTMLYIGQRCRFG
jgi:hypothetical protein